MNNEEQEDMKRYLAYLKATEKSQAKQEDVDELAKEIKRGRWIKIRRQVIS